MSLKNGDLLGPYQVTGKLGAGGMGEVYRAHDTRLNRDVAIKVLPPEIAGDASRRSRFEHEARAAAALNHPNIVATYDVGDEDGVFYIVSELVEGEGLDTLLARGTLPLRKLLDIAAQITGGMSAAHAAEIAHRDLKPANIMITRESRAKILDFGLAKRTGPEAPSDAGATVTAHHTEAGMVVGTVNYMSPEQASAREVDVRTDQFSFGVILYEMLSGKKPFERPTAVETMSAIINAEADPLPVETPAPVRWTVERCLAKDPHDRYASTLDLYRELCTLRDRLPETSSPSVAAPAVAKAAIPWAWKVGWLAVAAVLAAVLVLVLRPTTPSSVAAPRFTPFAFNPNGQGHPVWSPDGEAVAFETSTEGALQVYVRRLTEATPVQLTDFRERATPLLWTSTGQRIYFYSRHEPAGVWSVSSVGGEPRSVLPLRALDPDEVTITSDASAAVVFQTTEDDPQWRLWVSSPPGAELEEYLPNPFAAADVYNVPTLRFSPDGTKILLFVNDGGVRNAWLIPYPADAQSPPRRVLGTLLARGDVPRFSWMPDSRRIVAEVHASTTAAGQLWMADTESDAIQVVAAGPNGYVGPEVSQDGSRLLFSESHADYDIVSVDVSSGAVGDYIATGRTEYMPASAANHNALVYVTDRLGPQEIWLRADGLPDRPIVSPSDFPSGATLFAGPALSPSGDRVTYGVGTPEGALQLWISSVAGGPPVRLTNHPTATEAPGSWSPDGRRFAYWMLLDGEISLAVVQTSGEAAPAIVQKDIHLAVSASPIWSPDGAWILYMADGAVHLISPDGGTPRTLDAPLAWAYAYSSDGSLLYGIRTGNGHTELFSIPAAGGDPRTISEIPRRFAPRLYTGPAQRLSFTPDGDSLLYSTYESTSNLWLMDGFNADRR